MHFTRFDFLKTYQKGKKKNTLVSFRCPFNCPPSKRQPVPFVPVWSSWPNSESFLQDEVPF